MAMENMIELMGAFNQNEQSVAEWTARRLVSDWLMRCDPVPKVGGGQYELLVQMIAGAVHHH